MGTFKDCCEVSIDGGHQLDTKVEKACKYAYHPKSSLILATENLTRGAQEGKLFAVVQDSRPASQQLACQPFLQRAALCW